MRREFVAERARTAAVGVALFVLALGLMSCTDRDADVPVVVVFPPEGAAGTDVMLDVQSLRVSVRKGTPGSADMKLLSEKLYPADAANVSLNGLRGGRDRFVVLEGLDKTREEIKDGVPYKVLARGSTIPADYLPGGVEPPAGGDYDTVYLFMGRVEEMSQAPSSLLNARAFFGGAMLPGGNVAVAGGIGPDASDVCCNALSSVEVFTRDDLLSFKITGSMTSARAYPGMAGIGKKGALIAGGVATLSTSQLPIATAERLDDEGALLSQILPLGSPRMHLAAVSVEGPNGEDQAVIAGGTSSWSVSNAKRQVERWDGSQLQPYQPLLIARAGLASATLLDGTALLVGGFSLEPFGTGTIAKISDSAERLDTGDPSSPYDVVAGMQPHWAHTATRLTFGDVLIAGGSAEVPDAVTGIAVATSSADLFLPEFSGFTTLPPLATPRAHHAAAALPDDRVLVCGGAPIAGARVGSGTEPLGSCEILAHNPDGAGFVWLPGPDLLVPRYGHAMFALPDGSVLVVGGVGPGDSFGNTATAEIYTPTWPEPE